MPEIRHLVFIKSTPEKIYEAITTQKGIASWWSQQNNAKPEKGSVYRIFFGEEYYKEIKVTDMVTNKKVEWDILQAHPEWLNTKITFDITASKNRAELRFAHDGWRDYTDMFAQCNHHWGVFLQNLRVYCETGATMALANYQV